VQQVKGTDNPTTQMYGRVVVALMERHAAELEALRRLHAGELQTPTLGVNERYGRQADLGRLSGLVARSSASPKEKCRMQVRFLLETL
jgi:hypothetical protein